MHQANGIAFSDRDQELLEILTHKLRVLTVRQVGRTWWSTCAESDRSAALRIGTLSRLGWLGSFSVLAHPELPLLQPVIRWQPGELVPNFAAASYQCRGRWTEPAVNTVCVIATKMAAVHFGGFGGRFPRESEQSHDIHVAAVFLRLRHETPALAASWISEEHVREQRESRYEKIPDACIFAGDKRRVIEFGGAYKSKRLAAFHDYCAERNFPYEVW